MVLLLGDLRLEFLLLGYSWVLCGWGGLFACVVSGISLFVNSVGVFLFFYLWLLVLGGCFGVALVCLCSFVVCCFNAC